MPEIVWTIPAVVCGNCGQSDLNEIEWNKMIVYSLCDQERELFMLAARISHVNAIYTLPSIRQAVEARYAYLGERVKK